MPAQKTLPRGVRFLPLVALLTGCQAVVMQPSGDVALQQRNLLISSTILMLLIIVPVIVLTLVFAWRYRASNRDAVYAPDWDHSTQLELLIWAAPLIIVIAIGAMTWISTHTLDPYRPLTRIDEGRPVARNTKPLEVQVVALDWKWLFIYPELGIAAVNELAAPVDAPIHFRITASSVMNSFFVPALAGQIYAMPGMQTQLHAVINQPGVYEGFSANYSGAGFSHMRFKFHGLAPEAFERWVQDARRGGELTRDAYLQLAKPTEREPVRHWGKVPANLYDAILEQCVERGRLCSSQMMALDARRNARFAAGTPAALAASVCRADDPFAFEGTPWLARSDAKP